MALDPRILRPGDTLLYSHVGGFDSAIKFMTRSKITHIEGVFSVIDDSVIVVASRNGIGPNIYGFDNSVVKVRRPRGPVDVAKGMKWFHEKAEGCGYGYWDLVKFLPNLVPLVPQRLLNKGMICSTFWDEFLIASGFDTFAGDFDPGEVTPRDFDMVATQETIWAA